MKRLLLVFAILFTVTVHAAEVTTVILVRHAEKVAAPSSDKDPALSPEGEARAQALARVLRSSGITTIYTTPYARTRNTALPLAELLKVTPVEIKAGATYAADMAKILTELEGGTVLVVGHSNTTQHVMQALGITNAPKIDDAEYDNLFVVTLVKGSEPRMLVLKF